MAYIAAADRIKETTTVAGSGAATLLGAATGFRAFSAAAANGDTVNYVISSSGGSEWEAGIGTYSTTGPTITRTTVLSSSNSGSAVTFSAGTKDIFLATIAAAPFQVTNTTASTTSATGALTVAGGVGIAGAANIAGNLAVGGNGATSPTITLNGAATNAKSIIIQTAGNNRWTWSTDTTAESSTVSLTTNASTSSGQTLLTFSSTTGVAVGQRVVGTSIPQGAVVASFVANTSVTLSISTTGTVASGATIVFNTNTGNNFILTPYNDDNTIGPASLTVSRSTSGIQIGNAANIGTVTAPALQIGSSAYGLYTSSSLLVCAAAGAQAWRANASQVSFPITANSTSPTTGAVIISGGVGVSKDLYATRIVNPFSGLTSGATIASDASLSNTFTLTLATNATLSNPTNLIQGQSIQFVITQDATGSRTLAYGTAFKFPSGTVPVLSTAAGAIDVISCLATSTSTLLCNIIKDVR